VTGTQRKRVNALVPGATPSGLLPTDVRSVVNSFARNLGGLWVGGTVTISEDGVAFAPNPVNEALHIDLEPVRIPAGEIRSVRREFGWVTGIVVVEHARGELRFRCFGAKRLAAGMTRRYRGA